MPKFFINADNISDSKAYIDGDNARHLKKVLRASIGDSVTLCDGKGLDYNTVIAEIGENGIVCDPDKNTECKKTACYRNGGECIHTVHKEYRRVE